MIFYMPRQSKGATKAGSVEDTTRHYGSHHAVLGKQGRLVVPAELRALLHIQPGDPLTMHLEDGRLVIERTDRLLLRIQKDFQRKPGETSAVDELIQERREEARREAEE
jgi:AbrB family looped-hinge helix DNA binding protein